MWQRKQYTGTHTPLVSVECFEQVQAVFRGHNKPRYNTHEFAYRGLLTCAYDSCKVTAEIKRRRYTYYHCTGYRGKCGLPYIREEEVGDRLGQILKDIHIPDDQAYQDKLDGKISEEFWMRKSDEWQAEENQIRAAMHGLETVRPERLLDAAKILELANKAYFLYVKQNHTERAKLLKMVLSNCGIDAVSLYPTYRKPFNLIFQRVKTEEWCALGDSNTRPSGS